jgi:hypothetical protein
LKQHRDSLRKLLQEKIKINKLFLNFWKSLAILKNIYKHPFYLEFWLKIGVSYTQGQSNVVGESNPFVATNGPT